MGALRDIIAYIIANYPERLHDELSNARLTKMIYLADWHSAIKSRQQISPIRWYFDNYGPFVRDVENEISGDPKTFAVVTGTNMYGQPKKTFSLRKGVDRLDLQPEEKASLDHIIDITKKLYWNDFIRLVYSTHPVASSERYTYLNLIEKAQEYQASRE
ncbi:Panacea domain-containing protein [Pelagibacterium sediminicola]|uniref:Panacea domain-containing protein n=1 Tax=Pelagibacterium sediminicola TaxID=2248761 RepID=UPI000E30F555|nr:Panacea domain-containing protein [Pelagibacterium sediminicola]